MLASAGPKKTIVCTLKLLEIMKLTFILIVLVGHLKVELYPYSSYVYSFSKLPIKYQDGHVRSSLVYLNPLTTSYKSIFLTL